VGERAWGRQSRTHHQFTRSTAKESSVSRSNPWQWPIPLMSKSPYGRYSQDDPLRWQGQCKLAIAHHHQQRRCPSAKSPQAPPKQEERLSQDFGVWWMHAALHPLPPSQVRPTARVRGRLCLPWPGLLRTGRVLPGWGVPRCPRVGSRSGSLRRAPGRTARLGGRPEMQSGRRLRRPYSQFAANGLPVE
jgi:hypothetical protein